MTNESLSVPLNPTRESYCGSYQFSAAAVTRVTDRGVEFEGVRISRQIYGNLTETGEEEITLTNAQDIRKLARDLNALLDGLEERNGLPSTRIED